MDYLGSFEPSYYYHKKTVKKQKISEADFTVEELAAIDKKVEAYIYYDDVFDRLKYRKQLMYEMLYGEDI